jgi:hypothetical protein
MSDTTRRVVLIAATAIVLMGLVPPWVQTQTLRSASGAGGVLNERHTYGLLFMPPDPPRPEVEGNPQQIQPFNRKDVARVIRQVIGRKASTWNEDYDLVHEFLALNPSLKDFGMCNSNIPDPPEGFVPVTPSGTPTIPTDFLWPCGVAAARTYDLSGFRLPAGRSLPKYGRAVGWQTRLEVGRLLIQWALALIIAGVASWVGPARSGTRQKA